MKRVPNKMGQFVGNQRGQNIGNQTMGNQIGNVAAPVAGNYGNMNQGNPIKCFNYQGVGHMARNCPTKPEKERSSLSAESIAVGTEGRCSVLVEC